MTEKINSNHRGAGAYAPVFLYIGGQPTGSEHDSGKWPIHHFFSRINKL
jgi:hypothetical protein